MARVHIFKRRKKYQESIVKKLFRTYLVWIILCISVILCGTVLYVGNVMDSNTVEIQRQLTLSINQNIEHYLQDMDDFSMELVRSEKFQETVQESLPESYEEGRSTADLFSELYLDAYKMIQKKYHVGVITGGDHYIWMGNEYYIDKIQGEYPDFYQDYEMDGAPIAKYVERNEFLEASRGERVISEKDKPRVTLSRSFGKDHVLYNGAGILEVQVDEEDFAGDIRRLSSAKKDTGLQIHILNARGDTIFSESGRDGKAILEENGWKTGTYEKNGHYIYVYQIFNSEIYVLYTISLFDYYNRFLVFLGIAALVFLAVILIVLVVSYHVSLKFSKPIRELCSELEKVDLAGGRQYHPIDTDISELDYLSDSIGDLNRKLEKSMHDIITLKDFESQAKLLALQAQMQPHFLVNTLTTMGTMAEEGGNREVSRMCINLTQMFRYISAEESEGVRLYEEIRHVERYVDIMKERFPNAEVLLDLPLEMMNLRIPKLIVQPLVENSFKYCNRSRPYIQVTGTMCGKERWSIKVSDNGEGFSEEKAAEIRKRCEEGMEGNNGLSAKIDGMGLVNVYVRLHLFYRENIVFRIQREGIEIGGRVL